jgi:hypothetical protein
MFGTSTCFPYAVSQHLYFGGLWDTDNEQFEEPCFKCYNEIYRLQRVHYVEYIFLI